MILYFYSDKITVHQDSIHDQPLYTYKTIFIESMPALIIREVDSNVIDFIFKHYDRLEYYAYLIIAVVVFLLL